MSDSRDEWKLDEFLGLHRCNRYGDDHYVDFSANELVVEINSRDGNHAIYVPFVDLARMFGMRGYEIRRKGD